MSVEGLQNWVVQTGLMVSLLIVIILIIRRPFARAFGANAAYALWSLPLIRLCFPVISIPENWIPQALRPANTPPQEAAIVQPVANLEFPTTLPNVVGEPVAAVSSGVSFIAVGLMIWASIAVLWLCFQLLQQHQFKARLLAESQMISEELAVEAKTLAQRIGLKKTPKIRVSNSNLGPLVTGVTDPIIIVPKTFEADFDTDQRGFALTHEFAHLKRKDLWVALTALVFRAVNWPNPLVHFAAHRLRADQEAACDAYVVRLMGGETVHSYAQTLVKAAKQSSGHTPNFGQLAWSLIDEDSKISKGD